jgi:hypothetical protein
LHIIFWGSIWLDPLLFNSIYLDAGGGLAERVELAGNGKSVIVSSFIVTGRAGLAAWKRERAGKLGKEK